MKDGGVILMEISILNKHEFIQTYVLNRAKTQTGSLCGNVVAEEAVMAWDVMIESCRNGKV